MSLIFSVNNVFGDFHGARSNFIQHFVELFIWQWQDLDSFSEAECLKMLILLALHCLDQIILTFHIGFDCAQIAYAEVALAGLIVMI